MRPDQPPRASSHRFLLLFAMAWAGVSIAYTPFLTVLLPVRVDVLAGPSAVHWLASITFVGAIAASIANIVFGWLSDVTANRRIWVALGLITSSAFLLIIPYIEHIAPLISLIFAWQIALNMMIGPLAAWAGDCVPDAQKGILGGLLAFAPASGALIGAVVTFPGLADPPMRFAIVAAVSMACILPILLFGAGRASVDDIKAGAQERPLPWLRAIVTRMWCARLLVQIAESALFAYLYLWFRSIDSTLDDASAARILLMVLLLAAPSGLIVGHWADRSGRPIAPLRYGAILAAIGLCVMAMARTTPIAMLGYLVFGLATNIFLALHSAQTLRVLTDISRRGRDLGVFNLTNTIPSLFMPSLTLALVPSLGFPALFAVLALLSLGAAILLGGASLNKRDHLKP